MLRSEATKHLWPKHGQSERFFAPFGMLCSIPFVILRATSWKRKSPELAKHDLWKFLRTVIQIEL
jgi:hypothetical protein